MAIKAVATLGKPYYNSGDPTTWIPTIDFAPLVAGYTGPLSINIVAEPPGIIQSVLETDIAAAVKDEMINHGVTFGLLDTVRVL